MKTGKVSIGGRELVLSALSADQTKLLAEKESEVTTNSFVAYEVMRQTISQSLAAAGTAISANELGDKFSLRELVAMWTEIMNLTGLTPKKRLWDRL